MNLADITSSRLEKVLTRDKKQNPKQILSLLKSDLENLLNNYLELRSLNLDVEVSSGEYLFSISAKATHIKNIGIIS